MKLTLKNIFLLKLQKKIQIQKGNTEIFYICESCFIVVHSSWLGTYISSFQPWSQV